MSERLTKILNNVYVPKTETGIIKFDNLVEITQKLGSLEDIEEELGIDLIALIKAKDGVYFKSSNNIAFDRGFIDIHAKEIRVNTYYSYPDFPNGSYKLKFEDYSKTWSLRKEDLK